MEEEDFDKDKFEENQLSDENEASIKNRGNLFESESESDNENTKNLKRKTNTKGYSDDNKNWLKLSGKQKKSFNEFMSEIAYDYPAGKDEENNSSDSDSEKLEIEIASQKGQRKKKQKLMKKEKLKCKLI